MLLTYGRYAKAFFHLDCFGHSSLTSVTLAVLALCRSGVQDTSASENPSELCSKLWVEPAVEEGVEAGGGLGDDVGDEEGQEIQVPATDLPREHENQVDNVEREPADAEDNHHGNQHLVRSCGPGGLSLSLSHCHRLCPPRISVTGVEPQHDPGVAEDDDGEGDEVLHNVPGDVVII